MKNKEFIWTNERTQAAILLADDKLTDKQIAAQLQVSESILNKWKLLPEFKARLQEHVDEFRRSVMSRGVADKAKRLHRLNQDWCRLQRVIDERATNAPEDMIGGSTGMVIRTEKPSKFGVVVEDSVDTGLLSELRAMEMQAAKELGQIIDKVEQSGTLSVSLLGTLTEAEIDARLSEQQH